MKFAIFCCLLAICAFEIVHADLNSELDNLSLQSQKDIDDYLILRRKEVQDSIEAAQMKKKITDTCAKEFNDPLKEVIATVEKQVEKCCDDCRKTKNPANLQSAKDCCAKGVKSLKSQVNKLVSDAHTCFGNL